VTAIPYLFAIAGLYLNARAADRNGRYSMHVMLSMAVAAVALVLSVVFGDIAWLSILLVSFAMGGALAYDGPFWASSSRAMPVALAGTAMGLINALGNLGGFVGPYVGGYLQDVSHGSFLSTSIALAVALLLAGLVMLTVRGRSNPGQRAHQPTEEAAR
jgi:MFS family permease